jgi:hypothetical protein
MKYYDIEDHTFRFVEYYPPIFLNSDSWLLAPDFNYILPSSIVRRPQIS